MRKTQSTHKHNITKISGKNISNIWQTNLTTDYPYPLNQGSEDFRVLRGKSDEILLRNSHVVYLRSENVKISSAELTYLLQI
jgi:hypothetical protein